MAFVFAFAFAFAFACDYHSGWVGGGVVGGH